MDDPPAGGADIRGQYLFATQSPKLVAGLICTMLVVVLWVGSSELSQFIFDDADYSKPFFMTAFNTSMFSVYLLGFLFFPSWRESTGHDVLINHHDFSEDGDESESDVTAPLLLKINTEDASGHSEHDLSYPMVAREPARLADSSNDTSDPSHPGSGACSSAPDVLHLRAASPHHQGGGRRARLPLCPEPGPADGGARDPDASSAGACSASEDALRALAMPATLPWYQVRERGRARLAALGFERAQPAGLPGRGRPPATALPSSLLARRVLTPPHPPHPPPASDVPPTAPHAPPSGVP